MSRGVAIRALARRFKLSVDSLYRHSKRHLPSQLRAKLVAGPALEGIDLDKLRESESQSLLMHLIALRNRLFSSLDVAEEFSDAAMVSRVAAQLHRNLEVTGELLGDLATGSTSVTNILIAPQYVEMRIALVSALAPFPDAREAVAQVLHGIESKVAQKIAAENECVVLTDKRSPQASFARNAIPVTDKSEGQDARN